MPKIILFPSPFRSDRTFHSVEPGTTVREAVALTKPSAHFPGALLVLNDRQVDISDEVMDDGDTLIVRAVPAGEAVSKTSEFLNTPLGGALNFLTFGLTGVAVLTFYAGVGLVGWGLYTALNFLLPKPEDPSSNGSLGIHGGRNRLKPYTQVPVILGKSIISPPLGSKVFTDWDGSNPAKQTLSQVFVVGLGRLAITATKIGDRALADFGVAPTVSVQTLTNDTYSKIVTEAGVGIELKASAAQIQVSVADIDAMSLDVNFPSGLCSYNSDGNRSTSRTIDLTVEYKKTTTGTWTGAAFFALSYAENFTQAVTKKADITQAMLNAAGRAGYTGTWDVRITRSTADATDSKNIDRTTWSVLRSIQLKEPMSAAAKGITTRVALTIQATDQLNGAVDNFNCEAQSVVPCYDGTGSGAAEWKGATALGYPSTWKNVNMTTGGFTWNTWTGDATSNPAALYLWILRGPANPKPIPDTLIDWPAFEAWYTFCASKGLEVNAVWDQGGAMLDLLDKIAGVGRAASMMRDSKYSVIFDDAQSVPVQHFTPRNSRNFSASKAFPTPVHAIRSQFIDKDSAWKQAEQIVYMAGYSAGTATEFRTQQLWGVTNYQQAYKAIFYQVAVETLRPEVYQMEVDFEHLACQRGDLVAVSHDVLLYGLQAARVVSLTVNGGSQALTVTLDEDVTMEVGKSYGIRWRRMDGSSVVAPVNLAIGTTRTLTFATPVVAGSVPEVDDLCSFGISGSETQFMLVVSIEMQDEFSARVTLNNYDPAVYTADGGAIPAWSSGISLPAPVGYGALPDLSVPGTGPADPPPVFLPKPVYPPSSKIYAHWSFDEQPHAAGQETDIMDMSGNGHHAIGGRVIAGGTSGTVYSATTIVPEGTYRIESVGTTDFMALGASANAVGVYFVSTGTGSGTGTVKNSWRNRLLRSGQGIITGGYTSSTNRSYAKFGALTDYIDGAGQFWASIWFSIEPWTSFTDTQQGILGHHNETSNGLSGVDTTGTGFQISFDGPSSRVQFRWGIAGGPPANRSNGASLAQGLHHLLFCYQSDGPETWVDGVLNVKESTSRFYGDIISGLIKEIRAANWISGGTNKQFWGYIDEVVFGRGVLEEEEKLGLFTLLPGPQQVMADQALIEAQLYANSLDAALRAQTVDHEITYFTQAGDPSAGWTTAEKLENKSDLWRTAADQPWKTYTGTAWVDLSDPVAQAGATAASALAGTKTTTWATLAAAVSGAVVGDFFVEASLLYRATVAKDSANTPITGGAFVIGSWYKIVTIGGTSFTTIGASANTVGVVFRATGTGAGITGTARLTITVDTATLPGNSVRITPKTYTAASALPTVGMIAGDRFYRTTGFLQWYVYTTSWIVDGPALPSIVPTYAPKYLGKWLDSAPTAGAVGDVYTRYSATSGTSNRGVFRWNGATWDRTEAQADIRQAGSDIAFIIAYKNTAGSAIYGTAADYSGDSTVQADFAFFQSMFVGFLEANVIHIRNALNIGDKYNDSGGVSNPTGKGLFADSAGNVKLAKVIFDGVQGAGVLNVPDGITSALDISGRNLVASEDVVGDMLRMNAQGTWKGTASSIYEGGVTKVQSASPVSLDAYSNPTTTAFFVVGKDTSNSGTFCLMLCSGWTPSVIVIHNNTGKTFTFNTTTYSFSWTSPTDSLRMMILGEF